MKQENKFTIAEQVQIGDYVHDCEAGIIILAKEPKEDTDQVEMLVTARCKEESQLIGLLLEVMKTDKNFAIMFKTAVMHYELEMITKRYSE